ncbi:MAG: 3-deoxy-D-manno-octulosonic acid transferase [Elusimicrobia bacterium]|nr:3-deoxy-D-manno-octulosonic acid transferase [Candidatus Liberimonas magnetica]
MIFFYNLFLFILLVPAVIFLYLHNRKRFYTDFSPGIKERFGFFEKNVLDEKSKKVLWIHCASLGEIRVVESLAKPLKEKYTVVITVLTRSAKEYAVNNKLSDHIYYAPLDFTFIVQKFIDSFLPDVLLIIETELWPGMINTAKKNNLRVIIINARLSDHSYPNYLRLKFLWQKLLRKIDFISARSQKDMERFISLGCSSENVKNTGNLKYNFLSSGNEFSRRDFNFNDTDLIWLCASTRSKEEEIIINAWKKVIASNKGVKLLIAPRHLERIHEIIRLFEKNNIAYTKRSSITNDKFDCFLLDSFGELQNFYPMSDIVFVGGSLVDKGGQNPIEPARCAKPILFGPYMENFSNESKILKEYGGAIEVKNEDELAAKAGELISDKNTRLDTGQKAKKAFESQTGSIERTLDIVNKIME